MRVIFLGEMRVEAPAKWAFVEITDLGMKVDYAKGYARDRHDYALDVYGCEGNFIYTVHKHMRSGEKVPCGILIDIRSLKMLKQGCCPMPLTNEIIQQAGAPLEEKDSVLEASKLHKKGYLGGG